jgi:hypothetical protein
LYFACAFVEAYPDVLKPTYQQVVDYERQVFRLPGKKAEICLSIVQAVTDRRNRTRDSVRKTQKAGRVVLETTNRTGRRITRRRSIPVGMYRTSVNSIHSISLYSSLHDNCAITHSGQSRVRRQLSVTASNDDREDGDEGEDIAETPEQGNKLHSIKFPYS